MGRRFGAPAAPCTTCLEEHHRQGQSGERSPMALAAAHRVLQQRQALKITPAKTGYAELCRRAIVANHTVLSILAKDFEVSPVGPAVNPAELYAWSALSTQNYHDR